MSVTITPIDIRNQPLPADPMTAVTDDTHLISNAGKVLLLVQSQVPVNMTVAVPSGSITRPADKRFPAQAVPDIVVPIAEGELQILGPYPSSYQNSQGQLVVTFDASDGVKIGAMRVQ